MSTSMSSILSRSLCHDTKRALMLGSWRQQDTRLSFLRTMITPNRKAPQSLSCTGVVIDLFVSYRYTSESRHLAARV